MNGPDRGLRLLIVLLLVSCMAQAVIGVGKTAPQDVTIYVNTLNEELAVDGDCSLREAVYAANNNSPYDECPAGSATGMDTINFYANGTAYLTASVLLVVNAGPLTIDGLDQVEISGSNTTPLLWVQNGANLTLRNLTLRDGYVPVGSSGGLVNQGGTVIIDHSTFLHNIAAGTDSQGGAVYNDDGAVTVRSSTFEDNEAVLGGAIYNHSNASLDIRDTIFRGNSASDSGGAIDNSGSLTIDGVTFEDNVALSYGGAIHTFSDLTISNSAFHRNMVFSTGGAIMCSYATCTIDSSSFSGSVAHSGGAICSYTNKLYVSGSMFSGNAVIESGGAIELWNVSDFSISSSTFAENSANTGGGVFLHHAIGKLSDSLFRKNYANYGGGMLNGADAISSSGLTLERTTFWENNSGDQGGAIYNDGAELIMENDTLAYNTAVIGAGVYNTRSGYVRIRNSTFAWNGNSSPVYGDQLYNQPGGLGTVRIVNSILAHGGNGNCEGEITDEGANIDTGNTCTFGSGVGSLTNTDPLLGPLQDNGGPGVVGYPTLTFALHYPSPAINRANDALCPATDQRGFQGRIASCDIGSYQAQPDVFYIVSGSEQSTYINTSFHKELVVEVQDSYGNPLAGVPVHLLGPASGPSIANETMIFHTLSNGQVGFQAIANHVPGGPYEVYAIHSLGTVHTTFHLTNLAPVYLPMVTK